MADNVEVTEGSGKTIAGDDIGGTIHQRVKITVGADGTNDGDVASGNPLPVDVLSQPVRDRTTDNQGVAIQTDALMNDTTVLTPKYAVINVAGSGDNEIVAAVGGKKIRVLSYTIVCGAAVTARFESDAAGTALTGQMEFEANSGISVPFNPVGHFETIAGESLNLELSGAISVDGFLTYVEV